MERSTCLYGFDFGTLHIALAGFCAQEFPVKEAPVPAAPMPMPAPAAPFAGPKLPNAQAEFDAMGIEAVNGRAVVRSSHSN
jgi:hypothetical protein